MSEPETEATAEELAALKSIKTVSIDGEVISTHDLKSIRDDQDAEERKQNFQNGKLQRVTRFNMSGGFV